MGFSFWISEMAFWNSRMDLAEQYVATQADEIVEHIETSVKYGKSLSNYHGIDKELGGITQINDKVIGAVVLDGEGNVTAGNLPEDESVAYDMLTSVYDFFGRHTGEDIEALTADRNGVKVTLDDRQGLLYEIHNKNGGSEGDLLVIYSRKGIADYQSDSAGLVMFGIIYAVALVVLALSSRLIRHKNSLVVVIMCAMLAMIAYSFMGFSNKYRNLIEDNAYRTQNFMQATVDDLTGKGLPTDELDRFSDYYDQVAERNEAVSDIEVTADGKVEVSINYDYVKDKLRFLALTFGAIFAVCLMITFEITRVITVLTKDNLIADNNEPVPDQVKMDISRTMVSSAMIRVLAFLMYTAIYTSMPYAAVIFRQEELSVFGLSVSVSSSIPLTVELVVILLVSLLIRNIYSKDKPIYLFAASTIAIILGNFACSRTDSPYLIILLRAFCGVGFAVLKFFFNKQVAACSRNNDEIRRNFANMNAGLLGGITVGSSLGSILAGIFGYFGNYSFTAILVLITLIPGCILLKNKDIYVESEDEYSDDSHGVTVMEILKNKTLRRAIILTDIPLNVGLMYVVAFLPIYMGVIGKPAIATSYAYLINGLFGVYIGVFMMMLLRKLTVKKSVILSILIGAAGMLCLLFGQGIPVVIMSAAIMGLFDGYGTPTLTGYFTGLARESASDSAGAISIYGSIGSAVQIVCPALYSILAQPDGSLVPITIFGLCFAGFGLAFLIGGKKKNE